ncbi:class I SAM-dependent methyltransferase [Streptomyces sp. NPDC014864]|uniref:class I SAM-dependent methyltransferase n=1 Tax=Streptomyces sp. NPDC014864 TaxID=3364924 RepID=UPI0036FAA63A
MTDLLSAVERTALLTAALRAAESAREDRLYHDPYAARLAGDTGLRLLSRVREVTFPSDGRRTTPSTPDFNATRTRFFDEHLQQVAWCGHTPQIVLAPAGMDSRAYRLDWPSGARYFELDQPAVLSYKKERMPDAVPRVDHRSVAVDLTADDWEDPLLAAGYDPSLPSAWLIEGLLYYLPGEDVHRLLAGIAAVTAPGSHIAADLVNTTALTAPGTRPLLDVFADWGCPWRYGTEEPEQVFHEHGFTVEAVQPGDPAADYGRWPDPVPPRTVSGVPRVFLVRGRRR